MIRLFPIGGMNVGGSGGGDGCNCLPLTWNNVAGRPSVFPPATHDHGLNDVIGLNSELNSIRNSISSIRSCTCESGGSNGSGDCNCENNFLPLTGGTIDGTLNVNGVIDTFGTTSMRYRLQGALTWIVNRNANGNLTYAPSTAINGVSGDWANGMTFFPDGRFGARLLSENNVLLENKYVQPDAMNEAINNAIRNLPSGGDGEGGNCFCPPLNVNNMDWSTGSINTNVNFTPTNIGISWGGASIESRSNGNMFLIRANAVADSLNRGITFRPNTQNTPQDVDAVLFANGTFDALNLSENGVNLSNKYVQSDALNTLMPTVGHQLPQNSIHNNDLPTVYPMGPSLYTVNSNQLGAFPFPSGMISTKRFEDGRIKQVFTRITGQVYVRVGSNNLWSGGAAGVWREIPTAVSFEEIEEKFTNVEGKIETVEGRLGGLTIWSGSTNQMPADRDPNTLYFEV